VGYAQSPSSKLRRRIMKKTALAVIVSALATCLLASCGQKEAKTETAQRPEDVAREVPPPKVEPSPPRSLIRNGGFDAEEGWSAAPRAIRDGRATLQKGEGSEWAHLRQLVLGLEPNSRYALSLRLRAEQSPDDGVVANLIGADYASARLMVKPEEIGPEFKAFRRVISSDAPPDTVTLRVFTKSTVPIQVDDVSLTKLN
jgi:hypothetical protein